MLTTATSSARPQPLQVLPHLNWGAAESDAPAIHIARSEGGRGARKRQRETIAW